MQFDTRSLWIYLHFSRLQLDVIEHSHSANNTPANKTDTRARAIYEVQNNQIVQVNQAAQSRGIKVGMGLASASLLYQDLSVHEYRPELESNALEHLANALYLVSADIVLSPPKGIVLRAQNMLKLYGGLSPYWHIIQRCLANYAYHYHSAAGFSVQATKLMAKQGLGLITEERHLIEAQLQKCSLALSEIDAKDIEKLRRIGIESFAELKSIPTSELANRVGRVSLSVISELRGQSPAKVSFFKPLTQYNDYIELLYDISVVDKLRPVIEHALNKLRDFLYVRNARCLHINIDFYQREHAPMNIPFNSAAPIYRSKDWLSLIDLKLEQVRFQSPVYAIELHCHEHEVAQLSHEDFFESKSTHVASMSLMSRLINKLGEDKVSGLAFVEDFRPEYSTHCAKRSDTNKSKGNKSIFEDRPGLLLKEPKLLEQKVQVIKGPERIIAGWWDSAEVCRDYYIGQSEQGQQLWMFKTPEQKWYLHGYFV
jgi:protein ImuB